MEALILYPLILMAVGLMVAGIYGAMPVFVRHHRDAGGLNLALSSGVSVLEPGRLSRRSFPFVSGKLGRPERPKVPSNAGPSETEIILTGLFTEVDSLRSELEGLRNELSALLEAAHEQPSRKGKAKADVPDDLRRDVTEVRQRRLARV